jgi:hypothetical protein
MGSDSRRTRASLARRVRVPPRPSAGGSVQADTARATGGPASSNRSTPRVTPWIDGLLDRRVRDRQPAQPWHRAYRIDGGARASRRVEPSSGPTRESIERVRVGPRVFHGGVPARGPRLGCPSSSSSSTS